MSKTIKKHYKQFPLNSIEEGLQALGSLVSSVIINLEKYMEYSSELESLLEEYSELQKGGTVDVIIPSKEYDNINDKLLYRQRELLKFIADHQDSSFSYINLREYLVKRTYLVRSLDAEAKEALKELLDIRNWTFHNPQSMLVAAKESAMKRLPKEMANFVRIVPQINPIIIDDITHYDLNMLVTLIMHTNKRHDQFKLVLENMKIDYSEMYKKVNSKGFYFINGQLTQDVIYQKAPRISRFYDQGADMAQISMAIQKSKYDGSDESFKEWVIKKD